MSNPMTIDQARIEATKLREEIERTLNLFSSRTGLRIVDIRFHMKEVQALGFDPIIKYEAVPQISLTNEFI